MFNAVVIKSCLYIAIFLLVFGCGKSSSSGHYDGKDSSSDVTTLTNEAHSLVNYNLFIENSPSMDGYVINSNTGFKNILSHLVSDIYASLNTAPTLSFINDKVYRQSLPIQITLPAFIMNLNPGKLKDNRAGVDTQIDNIINLCLNGIDSNINILTSDCIFSKKNVPSAQAEYDLKMFIANKLEHNNITTIVLKYNSDYSGIYYSESENDKPISAPQINRPFYILIFGTPNNLEPLLSKINLHYKGFEESYCLVPNKGSVKIDAAITSENKTGNFSFQKPASTMVIYDASPNNNGVFQFSINTDLSKINVEKNFLLQPSNYAVNDNFKVVAVTSITDQSNYTHTLTLMTTNLQQNHNLKVGLKYDVPDWVTATGSTTDNNPTDTVQQHQTYGFQYLMQGIEQGYTAKNGELQFAIPVTISKGNNNGESSASGFPWWILIAVAVVVGIVIWLKNKS